MKRGVFGSRKKGSEKSQGLNRNAHSNFSPAERGSAKFSAEDTKLMGTIKLVDRERVPGPSISLWLKGFLVKKDSMK